MIRKILILLILLLAPSATPAFAKDDAPAVAVSVDKRVIHIGDRLRYILEVDLRNQTEVEFPKFESDKMGDFEIKGSGGAIKKGVFGRRVQSNWYDVTTYSAGKRTIPEAGIRYRKRGAKDWTLKRARAIEITVKSVLPTGGMINDIKDIKGPLYFFEPAWIVITGLIFILFSGMAIFIIYRMTRRSPPPKLPHESALEELEAAKAAFSRTGDFRECYFSVSDCVRRYLERVFELKAPEMTTEEFLDSLKYSTALSPGHKDLLKIFLSACDLVKFARYAPGRQEVESVFLTAKNFIDETRDIVSQSSQGAKG